MDKSAFIKHLTNKSELDFSCHPTTKLIVVIPCYNENSLSLTLNSLNSCISENHFEVVVSINFGEQVSEEIKSHNLKCHQNLVNEIKSDEYLFPIHPLLITDMPKKVAGVGMARKIGMDYACSLFEKIEYNGVLTCLDADCQVEPNYITEVVDFFEKNEVEATSIHYEHPFPADKALKDYIIDYELHLRYHVDFQKWLKLPFAFQTVGSSMAVRTQAYLKEGGMNKRKAGEDFYFIHKFTIKGTLGEIKNTTVLPSARISDRVPFGTGKAMQDRTDGIELGTYHYKSYEALIPLVKNVHLLYNGKSKIEDFNLENCIAEYLQQQKVEDVLKEIIKNTTSLDAFMKRFYQWFNAFRLMKYLHYSRDNYYPNIEVVDAAQYLYELLGNQPAKFSAEDYLLWFRKLDKGNEAIYSVHQ